MQARWDSFWKFNIEKKNIILRGTNYTKQKFQKWNGSILSKHTDTMREDDF